MVGKRKNNILNQDFEKTYTKFLLYLYLKTYMSDKDKVIMANYLIC